MRKLRLDLSNLEVTSFESSPSGRGGVQSASHTDDLTYGTNEETCVCTGGWTCGLHCNVTIDNGVTC